ncbi:MAG: LysR family transcriptional regulator, partial [Chloroflexota bacterium]
SGLRVEQFTVTGHIQALEAEWGVTLFERDGRGVQLTSEGRALMVQVNGVLSQMNALGETVNELTSGGSGHIRIGSIEPFASYYLPPVLATFLRSRPLLQVNVEVSSVYGICERLSSGELEFGIATDPRKPDFAFQPLYVQRHCLLIAAHHPLARKDTLMVDDIRGERLMFTEPAGRYEGVISAGLLQNHNGEPYAQIESVSVPTLVEFARVGLGLAVLPDRAVTPVPDGCVLRPVVNFDFELVVGIVYRSYQASSASVEALLATIRSAFYAM